MAQINVNREPPVVVESSSDRSSAAGINMITVLIVLAVLVVLGWFLFTGPLQSVTQPAGNTNINVNPPAVNVNPPAVNVNPPAVNVNPPAAPAAPAGNTGSSTNPAPAAR